MIDFNRHTEVRDVLHIYTFIENDNDFDLQAYHTTPPTGTRLLGIVFILKYFPFLIPSGNNVTQGFRNTYA